MIHINNSTQPLPSVFEHHFFDSVPVNIITHYDGVYDGQMWDLDVSVLKKDFRICKLP